MLLMNEVVLLRKFENESNNQCTHILQNRVSECADCLVDLYNCFVTSEYENQCPYKEKNIVVKDRSPWFNGEILDLKREKRKTELICRKKKTLSAQS